MIDKKAIEESGRRAIRKPTRKETKEHIKTLVENTNVGRMRNSGRIVKYGAASFTRNIWLSIAATLVMTVTLIILMITILASMILSATADTMRSKIDITVFFKPGTPEEILTVMSETMQADSNIRSIEVTSSEQELANLMEENRGNEALMATFSDPDMYQHMLDTMQATMRIKVFNPDNLDSIRNIVDTNPFFQENLDTEKRPTYDANQAEIATISSWASVAKNGGLILGAVFSRDFGFGNFQYNSHGHLFSPRRNLYDETRRSRPQLHSRAFPSRSSDLRFNLRVTSYDFRPDWVQIYCTQLVRLWY